MSVSEILRRLQRLEERVRELERRLTRLEDSVELLWDLEEEPPVYLLTAGVGDE